MNKVTKLLSVFILAGAVGAGVAGVAGCNKGGNDDKHEHHYTWVADADGNKCHEECDAKGECDAKVKPSQAHVDTKNNETGAAGADNKCDNCGATIGAVIGDKYEIPAAATRLVVEGVQTETIELSETKKSHDINQSAIKVYFGDASGKIGEAIPAANVTLRLQAPGGAAVTEWTGLKLNGDYTVRINIKDCKMAEGATTNMEPEDFFANITVTVSNPVKSLSVKEGATLTQVSGPNTITAGWTYEITRANGDKTDVAASDISFVTPVDTVSVGTNKTATFKATVDGAEVTGTVTYTITEDTSKVQQSFALNFGSFDDDQIAAIAAGEKVELQNGRFEVMSVGSGAIDNHNNSIGSKYFTKRLKTNGSSVAADKTTAKGTPRYIKVHADGAGTLTVYAYNNGGALNDGNSRGVTVYSGATFDDNGKMVLDKNNMVGEAKLIPSKSGDFFAVSIPEAGDYYITNDAAMTYCYVQLDQLVDKETNEAIELKGKKVYTKLSASHTDDTEEIKFKKTYGVGDTFEVDAGYTFKAEAINDVTCEIYDKETVTEGLTFWIGNIEITSGYTFTDSDLGPQTVTVKLGNVSANISIVVESAITGVTGITATVEGVNGSVSSADATVTLTTANIKVGVDGTNAAATAEFVSATYKVKGADGEGTALTAEGVALAVGEYEITVLGSVSADGASAQFTTTIAFSVVNTNALQNVVVNSDQVKTLAATMTSETVLVDNAYGKVFITADATNTVTMDASSKTIGGVKYTHRIKLGGAGATTYRSIGVEVKKGAKIVVHCMSSSSSAARNGYLYDAAGNKVNSEAITVAGTETVWEISVAEAGTYYFASETGGVNVYGVQIIYS